MRYCVTVAGRTFDILVSGDRVTLDGRPLEAVLGGIPATPLRVLTVNGRSRVYALSREGDHWQVQWAGERVAAVVLDERTLALREAIRPQARHAGAAVVRAPMPGLVLRLDVEVGQRVEAGHGLLVLEAMKMENEIRAPAAGRVRAVHVAPRQAVEKGVALVEIGD
jgi:pyruvate carboxylase subunit B